MKEIKFKTYIKNENKIGKVIDLNFGTKTAIVAYQKNEVVFGNYCFNFDEIKLMQYTGLHDKNGVEIYEGDIVKALINGIWYVGQVIYEHSGFIIDVMNNKQLEFGRRGIIERFTEVIGNIHDNPEKLEGE